MSRALKLKKMEFNSDEDADLSAPALASEFQDQPASGSLGGPSNGVSNGVTAEDVRRGPKNSAHERLASGRLGRVQSGRGGDYQPKLHLVSALQPKSNRNLEANRSANPAHIWFNWNGHSWCAFEVLGVPQASSVATAQDAFRRAILESGYDAHAFLNEAIQAIERCCK